MSRGGSLSERSLSGGVSIWRVSVQGGLCPMGGGVSGQGGLCPVEGGTPLDRDLPYSDEGAVRILLECILVVL